MQVQIVFIIASLEKLSLTFVEIKVWLHSEHMLLFFSTHIFSGLGADGFRNDAHSEFKTVIGSDLMGYF